jgi:hypothetical protein
MNMADRGGLDLLQRPPTTTTGLRPGIIELLLGAS